MNLIILIHSFVKVILFVVFVCLFAFSKTEPKPQALLVTGKPPDRLENAGQMNVWLHVLQTPAARFFPKISSTGLPILTDH